MLMAALVLAAGGCTREKRGFTDQSPGPSGNIAGPYQYNAYAISQGKRLFDWCNCSGCHAHGGGDIGPALMDARWIYGSRPDQLFVSVAAGRPNGMPAFRDRLTDVQIWQLVAYVKSLTGRLSRDALPARNDHLFDKPGEQSLPAQPVVPYTPPPAQP
jgi:cytochrome c oxidase cbb3-type subunit 3